MKAKVTHELRIKQRTDEWYEQRMKSMGGSDVAAIFGVSAYADAVDVWASKVSPSHLTSQDTSDTKRGKIMEAVAIRVAEDELGVQIVQDEAYYWADQDHMHASLDGYIEDSEELVEVKCPRLAVFHRIKKNGPKTEWLLQIQHYLYVHPDARSCRLIVFCSETCEIIEFKITPDEELQELIRSEIARFWKYVTDKVSPSAWIPTPKAHLYEPSPVPEGESSSDVSEVDDPHWTRMITAVVNARQLKDDAEAILNQANDEIRKAMMDEGYDAISHKQAKIYYRETTPSPKFDVKAYLAANPNINKEPYMKPQKPRRSLRVYPKESN